MSERTLIRYAGLIGRDIGHSRSPALQQAAFDALGLRARYVLWDTPPDQLAERVAALRNDDMLGANVTIPYKAAVPPLLDAVHPEAMRAVGVVNTIVRDVTDAGVRLVGHNTDLPALRRVLREHAAWTAGRDLLVLGAGGAARAALGVALLEGADVWIAARRVEAAQAALEEFWHRRHASDLTPPPLPPAWHERALALTDTAALAAALTRCTVVVHATPVGTRDPDAIPLPAELLAQLPAASFVFDMVYNPPETALVRAARAHGLRASGGLPMLLYQGAEAFTLWTGRAAPLDVMRASLSMPT